MLSISSENSKSEISKIKFSQNLTIQGIREMKYPQKTLRKSFVNISKISDNEIVFLIVTPAQKMFYDVLSVRIHSVGYLIHSSYGSGRNSKEQRFTNSFEDFFCTLSFYLRYIHPREDNPELYSWAEITGQHTNI